MAAAVAAANAGGPPPVIELLDDEPPSTSSSSGGFIDLTRELPAAGRKRKRAEAAAATAAAHAAPSKPADPLSLLECPVCTDGYDPKAAAGSPQCPVMTFCGHHAHKDCVDKWLASKPTGERLCFKCRAPLPAMGPQAKYYHPFYLS